ncbi:MAG: NUDIX hydrolase N-terminal domain-containing protein, partial [Actinomycetota bacterium]
MIDGGQADRLLLLIQRLAAISQTGLEFTNNPYDRVRFQEIGEIAES